MASGRPYGSNTYRRHFIVRACSVLMHVVSQRARVLRVGRTDQPLAITRLSCCLPPLRNRVGILIHRAFRSSIARLTDTYLRFNQHLAVLARKTQGRDGVAFCFFRTLSFPSRVEDWRGPLRRPSPIPATSNPACGFPALGLLACFASRVMWPIRSGALSRMIPVGTLGMH